MGVTFSQFFPPQPSLTEKNLPSQKGKVFIVTGGASGVGMDKNMSEPNSALCIDNYPGLELTSILFHAGGKVYVAGRSELNARKAIDEIKAQASDQSTVGQLEYLHLDLSDLGTIKASVEDFQNKESRLDVLWNNAGVSLAPVGSVSKQGHELMVATNSIGPYLFTKLLVPSLKAAARDAEAGSTRIVWTSSIVVDLSAPTGGLEIKNLIDIPRSPQTNYLNSKTGN